MAIVAGVALVNVPVAVLRGGAFAVAAAFTLEHPGK
jgi:hypothetical protein